jgi:hypothetical protein
MLKEKTSGLLKLRGETGFIGENWPRRFLKRHPQYKSRFPRHLDQDCYFNSNLEIFVKWFELVDNTISEHEITSDRIFNMNEKRYLMRVAEKVNKVIIPKSARNAFSIHFDCRK